MSNQASVLLIEDDLFLGREVQSYLSKSYRCHWSKSVTEAVEYLYSQVPDAIVGDYLLKDENSFVVLDYLNTYNLNVPFIAMSGSIDKESAIRFLNCGAKFLLEKPFNMKELLYLLEKSLAPKRAGKILLREIGLEVDLNLNFVTIHGVEISLTTIEYKILLEILANRGQILSRNELQIAVWGDDEVSRNLVHAHLSNLRKKLPCIESFVGIQNGSLFIKNIE